MTAAYNRPDIYDLDYLGYSPDISFYKSLAKRLLNEPNSKILELGCGTGRVTVELASGEFKVVGVDISEPMIAEALKKCSDTPDDKKPEFLVGNMVDVPLEESQFNFIIIPFNSFQQILTLSEQIDTVLNSRRMLKPGGYFLAEIGVPTLSKGSSTSQITKEYPKLGILMLRTMVSEAEHISQIVRRKFYYEIFELEDRRRLLEQFWEPRDYCNIYPLQWELLLATQGFRIVEKYGDFDFSIFGKSSSRMLFLCQKE